MESEKNITSVPEDKDIAQNDNAPIKAQGEGDKFLPVKYNKEIINLDFERAGELAQTGMKFESLEDELELLKKLAGESNKTVKQYLYDLSRQKSDLLRDSLVEKCGDNLELKNEVLRLYEQKGQTDDGFSEVQKHFPEIKKREDLPESVLENAKFSGRNLFDEFLRYRHSQAQAVKENVLSQQRGAATSVGSQINKTRGDNPETAEFLKGLWRK